MITPLDIENKKFSKRALNGYSTEEVDDFLDELTIEYEKIYKEATDARKTIEELNSELNKYKQMESTLQNTLLMAQTTAEEVKNAAEKQANMILNEAQTAALDKSQALDSEIENKKKEYEMLQKQLEDYKSKMESLLVAQLNLVRNTNKNNETRGTI